MNKHIVLVLFSANLLLAGAALAATKDATPGADNRRLEKATFAGGCFWCMEETLDKVDGVVSTTSGYTGGKKKNPTYEEVSAGETGHAESVEILYDPAKVSYAKLLEVFWHNIDPTTPDRQFCDYGDQYRPAIFYHDETQKRLAEESKKALVKSKPFKGSIVTEIVPPRSSIPPRSTTRTSTRRTRSATGCTSTTAAGPNASSSSGAANSKQVTPSGTLAERDRKSTR